MTSATLNSRSLAGNALENLPLSQLHEWRDNPRRTHDPAKHAELVESVRSQGLLQPLLVRPRADGFEVIAGNRRRRALVDLGDADVVVPCLVRDLDDDSALAAAIKENGDRDGLLPLEEAETYERLLQTRSVDDVAALVGKSTTHVRQRAKLLLLVPIARGLLSAGLLSPSSALQLAQLASPADQVDVLIHLDFDFEKVVEGANNDGDKLGKLTVDDVASLDLSQVALSGGPPTAAEVRAAVKSLGRVLARASFPILDADLLPPLPACNVCPNRTGAQASLFGAATDDDTCLDAACWKQKTARADALLLDRAQREGRLLTIDKTSKIWTKWGGVAHDAPFVALDDRVDWRGGTWGERLTDEERKEVRVAVDDDGRARELLPRAIADSIRARALPEHEDNDDSCTADAEAQERRAAEEKKRAEDRAKRDAAALERAKLEKAAVDLIVEKFSSSPAPDSVALAIAVAMKFSWQLPDLLGLDRAAVGSKPMAAAIKELVRRFDADRAGACGWVMRTLLEHSHLEEVEQDAVFDALLMLVAKTTLQNLRETTPPRKPKMRGKSTAAYRTEPDDGPTDEEIAEQERKLNAVMRSGRYFVDEETVVVDDGVELPAQRQKRGRKKKNADAA